MKNKLIIVSGPSASGKSTLAAFLSQKLRAFLISKDEIKEILFRSLGWSDKKIIQKIAIASVQISYYVLEQQLKTGKAVIIESNFKRSLDKPKIMQLLKAYDYKAFELHCRAKDNILFSRFQARSRHPGFVKYGTFKAAKKTLNNKDHLPLKVGKLIEIDTTDFEKIQYNRILSEIKKPL
jgi:predicted kinase